MITLIRGGWVVSFDGDRHQVIPNGEVAIQGDKVIYVGTGFPGTADRVVAKDSWLVSPGFINLHAHISVDSGQPFVDLQRHQRPYGVSKEFMSQQSLFFEPTLAPEEQRLSAEFSLVQNIKCGSTTVVDTMGGGSAWWLGDPPEYEETLVETAGRLGARVYLSPLMFRSYRYYSNPDGSVGWLRGEKMEAMGMEGLQEAIRFSLEFGGANDGLVQGILCPGSAATCSPELLLATKEAAAKYGLPIEPHIATLLKHTQMVIEQYGCSVIEHLHRIGFLGPEVILGHCVHITGHPDLGGEPDRDLQLIADSGASVAHCPVAFARIAGALYTLPRYLQAGVNVGIGCDMWPVDMVEEMRLGWYVGKILSQNASTPTARQVFNCATLGGARALQRDDLGRLAPGAKADVICIDLGRYHTGPVLEPIRALVSCAKGQDIEEVFINGRKVVSGGKVLRADEEHLQSAAVGIVERKLSVSAERSVLGGASHHDLVARLWET